MSIQLSTICKNKDCKKRFILENVSIEYCPDCRKNYSKIRNNFKSRKDYIFEYNLKNGNKHREYNRWYNTFRRKGTSNICSKPKMDNGKIDFEAEQQTVHNELVHTFRYQKTDIKWIENRLDNRMLGHNGIYYIKYIAHTIDVENVCGHCFYACFPNGINESGLCKLDKKEKIYDTSQMCWEIKNA